MSRMVRDFVDLGGAMPLEVLIDRLNALVAALPEGSADAIVRPRGDAVFGQSLQLTYLRPQSESERELEARYAPRLEQAA